MTILVQWTEEPAITIIPPQIRKVLMNYQRFFEEAIDQVHAERRYRVFADIERIAGSFPRAIWRANGSSQSLSFLAWVRKRLAFTA